jgi:hypothetical protein
MELSAASQQVAQNDAQICAQWTFKFRFLPLSAIAQSFACSSKLLFIIGIAFVSFCVVNEVTHARFFRFTFVWVFLVQSFFAVL